VAKMEEARAAYRLLVGKLEGRRQIEKFRCRWEDNIKVCFFMDCVSLYLISQL
jgi:hypothetical protein